MSGERGQVFTLDAMLSLIIITVILGLSSNLIEEASYKLVERTKYSEKQRIVSDMAESIIRVSHTGFLGSIWSVKDENVTNFREEFPTFINMSKLSLISSEIEEYLDVNRDGELDYYYNVTVISRDYCTGRNRLCLEISDFGESKEILTERRSVQVEVLRGWICPEKRIHIDGVSSTYVYAIPMNSDFSCASPSEWDNKLELEYGGSCNGILEDVSNVEDFKAPVVILLFIPEYLFSHFGLVPGWTGIYIEEMETGPGGFPVATGYVNVNGHITSTWIGEDIPRPLGNFEYFVDIRDLLRPGWNYISLQGPMRNAILTIGVSLPPGCTGDALECIYDWGESQGEERVEIWYNLYMPGELLIKIGDRIG